MNLLKKTKRISNQKKKEKRKVRGKINQSVKEKTKRSNYINSLSYFT